MEIEFTAVLWFWKGPAPWHWVTVPEDDCDAVEAMAAGVSYGWGMIPVTARIGTTEWTTSLFPKGGRYVVPLKAAVRRAEAIDLGDPVTVILTLEG